MTRAAPRSVDAHTMAYALVRTVDTFIDRLGTRVSFHVSGPALR